VLTIFEDHPPIEFTPTFNGQFSDLAERNQALAGRVLEQINFWITAWTPGSEDGQIIKHVYVHSKYAQWDIYRLKLKPEIGDWRVFFFWLNGYTPGRRRVAALVKHETNQKCYDDPKSAHALSIRVAINKAVSAGEIRKGTK